MAVGPNVEKLRHALTGTNPDSVTLAADEWQKAKGILDDVALYLENSSQQMRWAIGGQTDLEAFIAGKRQTLITNESGEFQLFRVGDAVSHRGVHAAMLDSRRLCMTL